jgi:hypothetical protein
MDLNAIREHVRAGRYRFSDHAVKRMIKRSIRRGEIEAVLMNGEIIEQYPEDKYSPSCLVCGMTETGRVLHVLISLPPLVVVVTTYEPDAAEWLEGKTRRRLEQ